MTTTFTIHGRKVRTASARRYIVVSFYNTRPHIIKRTDDLSTAIAAHRKFTAHGVASDVCFVYDTRATADGGAVVGL